MNSAVRWTSKALDDLVRLHEFLAPVDRSAAARTVQILIHGVRVLHENPRLGTPVGGFEPREVRRLIVGAYEVRYELVAGEAVILRLWHTREDR